MPTFALTELLGAPVFDSTGSRCGRVREVALLPQEDRARVATFIIRTGDGAACCHSHPSPRSTGVSRPMSLPPTGRLATDRRACFCWPAICLTSKSSTFLAGRWFG